MDIHGFVILPAGYYKCVRVFPFWHALTSFFLSISVFLHFFFLRACFSSKIIYTRVLFVFNGWSPVELIIFRKYFYVIVEVFPEYYSFVQSRHHGLMKKAREFSEDSANWQRYFKAASIRFLSRAHNQRCVHFCSLTRRPAVIVSLNLLE